MKQEEKELNELETSTYYEIKYLIQDSKLDITTKIKHMTRLLKEYESKKLAKTTLKEMKTDYNMKYEKDEMI